MSKLYGMDGDEVVYVNLDNIACMHLREVSSATDDKAEFVIYLSLSSGQEIVAARRDTKDEALACIHQLAAEKIELQEATIFALRQLRWELINHRPENEE